MIIMYITKKYIKPYLSSIYFHNIIEPVASGRLHSDSHVTAPYPTSYDVRIRILSPTVFISSYCWYVGAIVATVYVVLILYGVWPGAYGDLPSGIWKLHWNVKYSKRLLSERPNYQFILLSYIYIIKFELRI